MWRKADGAVEVTLTTEILFRRESGIFEDFETLLARIVSCEQDEREALLTLLLGPRGEQIPFVSRRLQLGEWQRILLVAFDGSCEPGWRLTLIGAREEG